MIQIPKWPKLKNDPNSKMTQFLKWPKFKNDPNSEMTKYKNDLFLLEIFLEIVFESFL